MFDFPLIIRRNTQIMLQHTPMLHIIEVSLFGMFSVDFTLLFCVLIMGGGGLTFDRNSTTEI